MLSPSFLNNRISLFVFVFTHIRVLKHVLLYTPDCAHNAYYHYYYQKQKSQLPLTIIIFYLFILNDM